MLLWLRSTRLIDLRLPISLLGKPEVRPRHFPEVFAKMLLLVCRRKEVSRSQAVCISRPTH